MKYWRTITCALALGICGLAVWAEDCVRSKSKKTAETNATAAEPAVADTPAVPPDIDLPPAPTLPVAPPVVPTLSDGPLPPVVAAAASEPTPPALPDEPPPLPAGKFDLPPVPQASAPTPNPPAAALIEIVPPPVLHKEKVPEAPPMKTAALPTTPAPVSTPAAPRNSAPKPDPLAALDESLTPPPPVRGSGSPRSVPPPPPPIAANATPESAHGDLDVGRETGPTVPLPIYPARPEPRLSPEVRPAATRAATTATRTGVGPYKMFLRMGGSGQPRFEIKDGDVLLLKVYCDRVDLKGVQDGVVASGHIRLHGSGLDGTCDQLNLSTLKGEVELKGNVRLTCYRGGSSSQVAAEQMLFQLKGVAESSNIKARGVTSITAAPASAQSDR